MAEVETHQVAAPTIPVKRKRKSTSSGADHDCSACQRRGVGCDRARPYCGPCMKTPSQQCPGYKTVLTWGMGVASRGKLRGKALPVPASVVPAELPRHAPRPEDVRPPRRQSQNSYTSAGHQWTPGATTSSKRQRTSSYPYPDPSQAGAWTAHPTQQAGWYAGMQAQAPYYGHTGFNHMPQAAHALHQMPPGPRMPRVQTAAMYAPNGISTSPVETMQASPHGYTQPSPYDQRNEHVFSPRNNEIPTPFGSFKAPGSRPILNDDQASLDTTMSGIKSKNVYNQTSPTVDFQFQLPAAFAIDEPTSTKHESVDYGLGTLHSPIDDDELLDERVRNTEKDEALPDGHDNEPSKALTTGDPHSPFSMPYPGLSSRMQKALNYYETAICPFLVASDGPENPYRKHIIRLAIQCPGLRNAIAALGANNFRMRQITEAPDFVETLRARPRRDSDLMTPGGPVSAEEQHYKTRSIELLNQQLTSPDKSVASSDDVLASLLVLCLYHVCNSGFSKFRTQLAGVQKVLRMRSEASRNDFSIWVEMFFAWLDVMTSAVNDRETEIRGDCLDMTNLTANLGPLEEFSGCDGRLFKLIAQLGRLNLLSQNRPVRRIRGSEETSTPGISSDQPRPSTDSISPAGTKSDESPNSSANETDSSPNNHDPLTDRPAFWREWQDIHTRLNGWTAEPTSDDNNDDNAADRKPQPHQLQLSEAFRYSALLYVKRLAHPDLPSSAPLIQDVVERSLSYISAIGEKSCVTKFMLWPLFVTGTECMLEPHRDLIRARCVEIQRESGFFNNVTGLRVLERVWRDADAEVLNPSSNQSGRAAASQTFKWRAAMDRLDGEYIVI